MVDLVQIGIVAIVVLVAGIYYLFFHKPDKEKLAESILIAPIDKKPLGICASKDGVSWTGYVQESKTYDDGSFDMKLTDGTKLVRLRNENIRIISPNVNIATGEGITFVCNVDRNNKISDWNLGKIMELSSISVERIRQEERNRILGEIQFTSKVKNQIMSKAESDRGAGEISEEDSGDTRPKGSSK